LSHCFTQLLLSIVATLGKPICIGCTQCCIIVFLCPPVSVRGTAPSSMLSLVLVLVAIV
jgi:hypothetical protein